MAAIEVKKVRAMGIGARIFEPGGRTLVRVNDDVLPMLMRMAGAVAVCDFAGNLIPVQGDTEITCVEMDRLEPILDADGQDVLIRGWQGSVN